MAISVSGSRPSIDGLKKCYADVVRQLIYGKIRQRKPSVIRFMVKSDSVGSPSNERMKKNEKIW